MGLHDGVRDDDSGDLLATKPPAVESLDSSFSGVNGFELHIDLSLNHCQDKSSMRQTRATYLRILFHLDGRNLSVLLVALAFDVLRKLLIPVITRFPASNVKSMDIGRGEVTHSAGSNMFFIRTDRDCIVWVIVGFILSGQLDR